MNLRIRARLTRLEKNASALRDAEESGPTMQQLLLAIDGSPQAGQFCELARRLVFPETTPRQAERIRQTLDGFTAEMVARLQHGEPIDDCPLDAFGLPAEWFAESNFARHVGPSKE